jgi:Family of unknown function (DUF6301)
VNDWQAIDTAAGRGLLARLRSLHWGWTAAETPDLLRRFGWTSVASLEGAGVIADGGLGLTGREVRVVFDGDEVDSIVVRVTDLRGDEQSPQRRAFAQDVFVSLVNTAVEMFGEPTRRVQDEDPRVDWRDERTTLSVTRLEGTVTVTLMTNERRDFWDEDLEDFD